MNYGSALLSVWLLGFLAASVALKKTDLGKPFLFKSVLAFPLGFALLSILVYVSYCFFNAGGAKISILAVYGLILVFGFFLFSKERSWKNLLPVFSKRSFKDVNRLRKIDLFLTVLGFAVFIYSLYIFTQLALSSFTWNAHGGWDAKFFWHVKAKFYFRDPAEWTRMFSPLMTWTHPGYPLLLPGAIAWGWNFAGEEILIWPGMISFLFVLMCALTLLWHLWDEGTPVTGLWAAAFILFLNVYLFWASEQYAEIPLSFFILTSTVILLKALRKPTAGLWLLAGACASFVGWTKNEGILFSGVFLTLGACLLWQKSTLPSQSKKAMLLAFLGGAAPALLCFLHQKFVFAPHGEYWGAGHSLSDYLNMVFLQPEKTAYIFESFFKYMFMHAHWNGLWYFFVFALCYRFFILREGKHPYHWLPALLCLIMLSYYILGLHLSPYVITMQIQTALTRLLLHASMPALVFTFESFRWQTEKESPTYTL